MTEPTKPIDNELQIRTRIKMLEVIKPRTDYLREITSHHDINGLNSIIISDLLPFLAADRKQLLDRVEKDIIGGEDPADIKMGDKYYDSGNVIARKKLKREQHVKLGDLRKEYLGDE